MSRVRAFVHLSCLAAVLAPTAVAQQRPFDGVLPADAPVSVGKETWQACRVVDAVTGAPIVGAELSLVDEAQTPMPGKMWSKRTAKSDADGFLWVRSDDVKKFGWMILRAPGYGVASAETVVPSLVWALSPAVDVPVELRDWLGRPIAEAGIGWCVGCGHTPDVVNTRTDGKGQAVVRGVDPNNDIADLYPEGPELSLGDYGRVDWVPGAPPAIVRVPRGMPVRGKLTFADGKPAVGAFVGVGEVHRGPWAEVAADGTFEIQGVSGETDLLVLVGKQKVLFERPDGEQPFALQLPELPKPAGDDDDDDDDEGGEGKQGGPGDGPGVRPASSERRDRTLVVNLPGLPDGPTTDVKVKVMAAGGDRIDELLLGVIGPLPRHILREEEIRDGLAEFSRLPGTYEVVCLTEGYERLVGRFEVHADKPLELTLQPRPLAKLRVRVPDFEGVDSIWLRTVNGSSEIKSSFGEDGTAVVLVPNEDPFVFTVSNTLGLRHVVGARKGDAEFVLQPCSATHVTGQVVGPNGVAVKAAVAVVGRWDGLNTTGSVDIRDVGAESVDDGKFDLASSAAGLAFVSVVPADASLRPRLMPVILPPPGVDGRVDLGKVALRGEAELLVLDGEGQPMGGAEVGLVRTGWTDVRDRCPAFTTDDRGGWMGPDLKAGDAIVVPAAPWDIEQEATGGDELAVDMPFRTVLEGAGPWRIRVPVGQLHIDVKTDSGEPVRARVFLGDRSVLVTGPTLLRQLVPGKVKLMVTAPECKSVVVEAEVPATGRGEVIIKL